VKPLPSKAIRPNQALQRTRHTAPLSLHVRRSLRDRRTWRRVSGTRCRRFAPANQRVKTDAPPGHRLPAAPLAARRVARGGGQANADILRGHQREKVSDTHRQYREQSQPGLRRGRPTTHPRTGPFRFWAVLAVVPPPPSQLPEHGEASPRARFSARRGVE
jgi:hypothetical protein